MSNSVAQEVPGGTRLGEYEVVGLLGAGGMGAVYRGVHPIIGKEVAIKVLAPHLSQNERMVQRFLQEARAVVKIQHANIIDVFAFGHEPNVGHYFVMPLLAGESLGQRIARGGPLPMSEVLPILEQMADALDTAHEAGIFHRDLKPDNIFLVGERSGGPSVRILDFGIAKLVESDVSATQTGVQMGTPLFMSPEQWDGRNVDHRTDIYALGVMIHHLVTGRYPFHSDSQVALMNLHVNGQPNLPSCFGADESLDAVIAKALAKDKEARFDTVRALYEALVKATKGTDRSTVLPRAAPATAMGTADTQLSSVKEHAPSVPWRLLGFGVLGVAVLVFGITALGGEDSAEPGATPAIPSSASSSDARPQTSDAREALAGQPAKEVSAKADAAPIQDLAKPASSPRVKRRSNSSTAETQPSAESVKPPKTEKPPKESTKWGETVDPY